MARPTGAGALRQCVRFDRRPPAADGYGNTQGDWTVLIQSQAASLLPTTVKAGEAVLAARAQGVSMLDLWVRADENTLRVTTDDRVVDVDHPTRTFNIRFIGDMDGRGAFLLMQLELGAAD